MVELLFEDLDLSQEIKQAIKDIGFVKATEIQAKTIPIIKQGYDLIGKSQTGTGKTLAFGIPAIEHIEKNDKKVQVLVLCPTRELAMQANQELNKLCKFKRYVKIVEVYGGTSIDKQIVKLKSANIVIGTPGRIMDHMRRKTLKLDNLKMIVLDEADEMLNMGFREDIETILKQIPKDHQTVLFSATMPKEIIDITKHYQKDPIFVEVDKKQVTVKNIKQIYYNVPMGRKMDALNLILRFYNPKRAIIFCNTKKMVDDISDYLSKFNFNIESLHGDMKQSQRTKVMNSFKKGKINILIATDVVARGIDVNDIEYVINYDIPQNIEYYIHRIGRTGRAGKSGTALTICSGKKQVEILKKIAKLTKSQLIFDDVPTVLDISKKQIEYVLQEVESIIEKRPRSEYLDIVKQLVEKGYDYTEVAAAVLERAFENVSVRDINDVESIKNINVKKSGSNFKKIMINIGRKNKVAPNHIVGAITEITDLYGKDIGKIDIYDNMTVVAIPCDKVENTILAMNGCKICGVKTTTKIYSKNKVSVKGKGKIRCKNRSKG